MTGTITGLPNGSYDVTLTAANSVGSATSGSYTVRPYGPPKIQNQASSGDQTGVKFTWTVDWNGGDVGSVTSTGSNPTATSARIESGCGKSATITVTATPVQGAPVSNSWSDQALPCPNPTFSTSHGGWTTCKDKDSNPFSCRTVSVSLAGWSAGQAVRCTAAPAGNNYGWDVTVTVGTTGDHPPFNNGLFDTTGANVYPDGTFSAGTDVNGLTCR